MPAKGGSDPMGEIDAAIVPNATDDSEVAAGAVKLGATRLGVSVTIDLAETDAVTGENNPLFSPSTASAAATFCINDGF